MNQYEQFTVYVSKEPPIEFHKKINWAEVHYRIRNSNKPLLAFGYICLLGGSSYLMWSNFSSANNSILPVKILSLALLSWFVLYLSMKNVKLFEAKNIDSHNIKSADDIRAKVALTGIDVKTTKDLFRLLAIGKIELFHDIREHTLVTLLPRREKDVKQVNRFFDTIQYCVENNQKTVPDDVKISVDINDRNYPEISGVYINKLMGRRYKSANIYLEWLSD